MALCLEQFIWAEDKINQYEQFWVVWEKFYPKIVESGNKGGGYNFDQIIRIYLLAWNNWNETAKDWRSLREREKKFYKNIIKDLEENTSVLDSIAQFLNQIGSNFLDDGILWISHLVRKNKHKVLGINTVFYTAQLVRKYIYLNRTKVKYDGRIKVEILIILNFLVNHGSVNAYLLREDIL